MNRDKKRNLSMFMSKILRHTPEEFGVLLDDEAYCELEDLLIGISNQDYWKETTIEDFKTIVEEQYKQKLPNKKEKPKIRYTIKGTKIRANYGHTFKRVEYKEGIPSEVLIHGTHTGVVELILKEGLKKMQRQYVHMSEGEHFATLAGARRGKVVLLNIDSKKAREDGIKFYDAGHGVWLADYIPPKYLSIRSE